MRRSWTPPLTPLDKDLPGQKPKQHQRVTGHFVALLMIDYDLLNGRRGIGISMVFDIIGLLLCETRLFRIDYCDD